MENRAASLLDTLLRQSRTQVVWGALAGVVSGICGAAVGVILGRGVTMQGTAGTLGLPFLLACAFFLLSKSLSEVLLVRLAQGAVLHLRMTLSRKVLDSPHPKLQALGKSELLAILTADVSTFVAAFQMVPQTFSNSIVIALCLAYMGWLSPVLCSAFILVLLVGISAYRFAERRPLRELALLRQRIDQLYRSFRGLIEGSRELQMNRERASHYLEQRVGAAARASRVAATSALTGYVWVNNAGSLLFYAAVGLLIFVLPGSVGASNADLTTFSLVILFLIRPISETVSAIPTLRQASVAWAKISQLEASLDSPVTGRTNRDDFGAPFCFKLQLDQVEFHHAPFGDEPGFSIGPINLTLRGGELVFVVGGNGSGKTTFSNLVLGLFSPTAGEISLNSAQVNSSNRYAYQQRFSPIFSDFHLFDHVYDATGHDKSHEASELLNLMELSDKVSIVDGCFSTTELSMGQRKRLALVTALLDDRPIHLYDEWAADQDPGFRKVFYTRVLPLLKGRGKLVIAITHDDAYFHLADRVLRLDNGQITSDSRPESIAAPSSSHQQMPNLGY